MPPRAAPDRGQAQRGQWRGRGGRGRGASSSAPSTRGASSGPVATRGGIRIADRDNRPSSAAAALPALPAAASAVGMNRLQWGTSAVRVIKVVMNSYRASGPEKIIYQYAVAADVDLKKLPLRYTHELFDALVEAEPTIFHSSPWFDGRAIMYSTAQLDLGPEDSREFIFPLANRTDKNNAPMTFKFTIAKVEGQINPETYQQFIQGSHPQDEYIQMVEMAVNTAFRGVVAKKYTTNRRSFFSAEGRQFIGGGLEIRRGFFHSFRPSISGPMVTFDISSAVFYPPGPLISICLDFLRSNNVKTLTPTDQTFRRQSSELQRFLRPIRCFTKHDNPAKPKFYSLARAKFTVESAEKYMFPLESPGGQRRQISVARYYKERNIHLAHPYIVCLEFGKDKDKKRAIPLELFHVPPGQLAKVELGTDQRKAVVEFSTKRPDKRFEEIEAGFQMVGYGQSEYIRGLGVTIEPTLVEVDARVLAPPVVHCNPSGRFKSVNVKDGKWNMLNTKYASPARCGGIIIALFENERGFGDQDVTQMVQGFLSAGKGFGMTFEDESPPVYHRIPRQASYQGLSDALKALGKAYIAKRKQRLPNERVTPGPGLLFAVLPPNSLDLYNGVKRFGDVTMADHGLATQCLLSNKCRRGNHQYWANVCLKVNAKLGGVNFYPDLNILDDAQPTIMMGADAIHPPPGVRDKPSVTAVVSSLDSKLVKYIAESRVQKGKQEIIADMREMCLSVIQKREKYQREVVGARGQIKPPTRLIMYRDGVSEGEFQQVLDEELPEIRKACKDAKINPKITYIVVGKRHHHRGKTKNPADADASGNVPAGTTIDTTIVHPLQNDYIQWTHGGLLGTSRPAHFTVLHDENNFNADGLQALSFGLAHSFARSTRSVSIPAPVYYADIVCARKGIYMNHEMLMGDRSSMASSNDGPTLEDFKKAYTPPTGKQAERMFFM